MATTIKVALDDGATLRAVCPTLAFVDRSVKAEQLDRQFSGRGAGRSRNLAVQAWDALAKAGEMLQGRSVTDLSRSDLVECLHVLPDMRRGIGMVASSYPDLAASAEAILMQMESRAQELKVTPEEVRQSNGWWPFATIKRLLR